MASWMLILALVPMQSVQQARAVLPAGTAIHVRFPESVEGGRDRMGAVVRLQTTAALEAGGCSVVPAFASLFATVVESRPAGLFGRRGRLELQFDSLSPAAGVWVPLSAVLDSLEWAARGTLDPEGEFEQRPRSLRGIVRTAGAAGLASAAAGFGIVPFFVLTGLDLALRGGQAHIFAGQRGALRVLAPLDVPAPERCEPATDPWASTVTPAVPPLPARATNRSGKAGADPINLLFLGERADLDSAFARAGWLAAQRSTFGALARETEDIVLQRRDSTGPMSHEYYLGRVEDLRFERASPSARARHHVRLWHADSSDTLWAAAATEDVGILVSARSRTVTHRIAPNIDRERDLLVDDLLAVGCVTLVGYATLPGAERSGTSVARQPFVTDGRVAVMRTVPCAGATSAPGPPS
jgi:hypothetical protein